MEWQGPRRRAHVPDWLSESASPNLTGQPLLFKSPRHPSSAVSGSDSINKKKNQPLDHRICLPSANTSLNIMCVLFFFTLLLFFSSASRSARDPEEEPSQLHSERRRRSFHHWKELPERNQSTFSGEHFRCDTQLRVFLGYP